MYSRGFLCFIISFCLLCKTAPAIAVENDVSPPVPALQGTFLQLLSSHNHWTESEWRELFASFKTLQLSQIIIQWSVLDEMAFYPSEHYHNESNPPLKRILDLADEYKINVLIGLAYDTQYWNKVQNEPNALQAHFKHFYKRSLLAAKEILPQASKHSSFQGWYISEEIDDINWHKTTSQHILFHYLNKLTQHLHVLTPNKKVALSGFSNAVLSPEDFQTFWHTLLTSADIDIVLFQDGIGVNKLQLDNLPDYFHSIKQATRDTETELQAIIETFTQVAGTPINHQPFRAVPAPLERIIQQLFIAAQYTQKNIAFSVPEYMTPKGGIKANQLYQHYTSEVLNIKK